MGIETHWLFLIVGAVFTLLSTFILLPRQSQLDKRKNQSENFFRENIISKQLDVFVQKRVRRTHQIDTEKMCLQAGIPLKFIELTMIGLILGASLGIFVAIYANNLFMGVLFALAGFMMPRQFLVFVRNRRVERMSEQIGSFMYMVLKRYQNTGDFAKALEISSKEFIGIEPLHTELRRAVMEVNLGRSVTESMDDLAVRTGNPYMQRLSDYYRISSDVGTEESRVSLMEQAYKQYDEHRETKQLMRKELSGVKRDAYIMLGAIPAVGIYQATMTEDYLDFIRHTMLGQVGIIVISIIFVGGLWFINNKISAPLE